MGSFFGKIGNAFTNRDFSQVGENVDSIIGDIGDIVNPDDTGGAPTQVVTNGGATQQPVLKAQDTDSEQKYPPLWVLAAISALLILLLNR